MLSILRICVSSLLGFALLSTRRGAFSEAFSFPSFGVKKIIQVQASAGRGRGSIGLNAATLSESFAISAIEGEGEDDDVLIADAAEFFCRTFWEVDDEHPVNRMEKQNWLDCYGATMGRRMRPVKLFVAIDENYDIIGCVGCEIALRSSAENVLLSGKDSDSKLKAGELNFLFFSLVYNIIQI